MKNSFLLSLFSVLILSCRIVNQPINNQNGRQFVDGYYLENPNEEFCTYRFAFPKKEKQEIYKVVDYLLPPFSEDIEYFVSSIGYGINSYIEISSSHFCHDIQDNSVALKIVSEMGGEPLDVGSFDLINMEGLFAKYGEITKGINLDNPNVAQCWISLMTDRSIYLHEIYELRYRYSIPILYHEWSTSKSIILFENNCQYKEKYMEDVLKITGITVTVH